jgi:tetrahydromethanopterin S-methyltransferase subunit B
MYGYGGWGGYGGYGGYGAWPIGAASTPGRFSPSRVVAGCGAGYYANTTYGVGTGIIAIAILILIALGVIF